MNFQALDSHEYRIGDDLLFVRLSRPAHAAPCAPHHGACAGIRARFGRVLVLTDSSAGAALPPETGQGVHGRALTPETRMDYQAVFGMAAGAADGHPTDARRAASCGAPRSRLSFFAREADARAYLRAMRQRMLTGNDASTSL